jgi:hypothetical protein
VKRQKGGGSARVGVQVSLVALEYSDDGRTSRSPMHYVRNIVHGLSYWPMSAMRAVGRDHGLTYVDTIV